MRTYPLQSRSVAGATEFQFKIIDAATHCFTGEEALSLGDLGVARGTNRPAQTMRVERVFAAAFGAPAACLVRGAGTGALRWALGSILKPGQTLLVHAAPVYPTTQTTIEMMGLRTVRADFNDDESITRALAGRDQVPMAALIQHARQKPDDRYDLSHVIEIMRSRRHAMRIITDDNYAAAKVCAIGCELGADLATFSCFKVLGPEGVGIVLGARAPVERIRALQYSGGSQVQGHEAMAALRGLIYAPVALAITGRTCDELADRLKAGAVPHVTDAAVANAESKALIVEFDADIADRVLALAPLHGCAPHPVGCESRYEFLPMFYRISATFRATDPTWERRMIRINVMRSGPDTIIRLLGNILSEVWEGAAPCSSNV